MLDGFNDVGWARLGRNTLGVTWSTSGGQDEADMALNTSVRWNTGCTNVSGSYDVQTVLLQENGHVAASVTPPARRRSCIRATWVRTARSTGSTSRRSRRATKRRERRPR